MSQKGLEMHAGTSQVDRSLLRCGLCGEGALRHFASFDGIEVARCSGCGAGLVVKLPGAVAPDDYAARYEAERTEDKARQCLALLDGKGLVRAGARVFDVGCGHGRFLDLTRDAGLVTGGLELSEPAAWAASLRGHAVEVGSAEDGPWCVARGCDLVTFWDLLEHLRRPGRALAFAFEALAPGGTLVVATPFMGSTWDRAGLVAHRASVGHLPQFLRMCFSREHLFRFDPQGLSRHLKGLGFARVETTRRLLLSLDADRYGGGTILKSWTGNARVDRIVSRTGVFVAKTLDVHNKILVVATKAKG